MDTTLVKACENDLRLADSQHDLDQVKSRYLGPKSALREQLSQLSSLSSQEKATTGRALHLTKKALESAIAARKQLIDAALEAKQLAENGVDTTVPATFSKLGSLHPLTKTQRDLLRILSKLGFDVADGPEIETSHYNFTALNTPLYHPAVTSQDTMYLADGDLLRSHTSCVQIHTMEQYNPPLRVVAPGRVYRADTPDATHSPCFMQCEGLVVDENCTLFDLKKTLKYLLESFFQKEIKMRFRPSFFPFTEPSFECDIWFNDQWLEVLGCGMVHPNVLANVRIDTDRYHGYAFGVGIDRLAMLRYNITDIRSLYEGKIPFLSQFSEGV